jgi:hypothetical protein
LNKIALQYDLKNGSVELLPSASDEVLNKHVFKLIKNKEIIRLYKIWDQGINDIN